MEEKKMLTNKEMEAEIESLRANQKFFDLLGNGCLFGVVIMIFMKKILFIVILIVAAIFLWGKASDAGKKIKELLSDNIIISVIKEVLGDDVEYNPHGSISPSKMVFPFDYSFSGGSDYIKTVYHGVNTELSDIELVETVKTTDENGVSTQSDVVHFKGQWLTCDFGKELAGKVYISEWTNKQDRKKMISDVTMDNQQFSNRFCVKADNPQEAYYILTPHMMEYIISMADKSGSAIYMSFLEGGKLHVAVRTGRDFFELGKSRTDMEELHQKFTDELRWFTDIIDTLRVEDTLYKKETNV